MYGTVLSSPLQKGMKAYDRAKVVELSPAELKQVVFEKDDAGYLVRVWLNPEKTRKH